MHECWHQKNILVALVSITLIHYFNGPIRILIQLGSTGNSRHHCLDFGCVRPTKFWKLIWQLNSLITMACGELRVIILVYYLYMTLSTHFAGNKPISHTSHDCCYLCTHQTIPFSYKVPKPARPYQILRIGTCMCVALPDAHSCEVIAICFKLAQQWVYQHKSEWMKQANH